MRVKVIETRLNLYPFNTKGIPDKRYRSGYRELPTNSVTTEFCFTLENPNGILRINEHIFIVGYSDYLVVSKNGMNNTVEVKTCRMSDFQNRHSLTIPNEVELISKGFKFSEGTRA